MLPGARGSRERVEKRGEPDPSTGRTLADTVN